MTAHSLYLHIPFCTHRCAYCDFNTYADQEMLIPAYVDALCREVEIVAGSAPETLEIHTIYFGGGTPSLLAAELIGRILHRVRSNFRVDPAAEVSLEANPGTVSEASLTGYRDYGITRLSLGVQSANTEELRLLERSHDFVSVIDAVAAARKAAFRNLSVDLIFGLPGQSLSTWGSTVRRALDLGPEHISAYGLTLEHGTPFAAWAARGLLPIVDPDLAADMYELASEAFVSAGFHQYEISNWAFPDMEYRHNMQYWRGLPYLGLGAGAHGYAGGVRTVNALRIATYVERMAESDWPFTARPFPWTPATVSRKRILTGDEMSETMMMGLRLTEEGVSSRTFLERFGLGLPEMYAREIDLLVGQGLVEWCKKTPGEGDSPDVLRLTRRGRLLGNQVFMQFLS